MAAGLAGHSAAKLSSSLPSTSSGARGGQHGHIAGGRDIESVGGGVSQLLSLSLELSVPSSPPPPAPQRRAGERASTCVRARAVPCPRPQSVSRAFPSSLGGPAAALAGWRVGARSVCSSGAYFFLRSFSSHRLPLPACLPARSLGPAKASAQKMFFAAYVWRRTRTGHVWRARDTARARAAFLACSLHSSPCYLPGRSVSVSWVGSQGAR